MKSLRSYNTVQQVPLLKKQIQGSWRTSIPGKMEESRRGGRRRQGWSGKLLGGCDIPVKFWIMGRNLPAKGPGERGDILHKCRAWHCQGSLNCSAWLDGKTLQIRGAVSADFGRCQTLGRLVSALEFEFYPGGIDEPGKGFKQWSNSSLGFLEVLIFNSSFSKWNIQRMGNQTSLGPRRPVTIIQMKNDALTEREALRVSRKGCSWTWLKVKIDGTCSPLRQKRERRKTTYWKEQ